MVTTGPWLGQEVPARVALLLVLLLAPALCAQMPGIDEPDPPTEEKPKEQPKDKPPDAPKDDKLPPPIDPIPDNGGSDPSITKDLIEREIRRRLDEIAPLRSRKQLFLELGGGLCIKYRSAEKNDLAGIPDGGQRAPTGFGLDRAFISLFAGYSELVEANLELRFNGNYTLLNEEVFEVPRANVIYNRPLGQFIPAPQGMFSDSLLFGSEYHFYRQAVATETTSLAYRAFMQDDVLQARYTLRFMRNFYVVGALADGTLLGRGQIDDSNNYPLLADDRTRYWRGLGEPNEVSRYLGFEYGFGLLFDWNATSFLEGEGPWIPERAVRQNTNFVHVQAWMSVDQLSKNELALIEGLMRIPFKGGTQANPGGDIKRQKWRAGANFDFSIRIADGDLVLNSHVVHAEDGRFVRNAWGVEVRYTFVIPRVPFFLRITPLFRHSELTTNNPDNPLDERNPFDRANRVSSGGVAGFSLADGAGFGANRREYMFGISLALARNVTLGFEAVFNDEDFKQKRAIANDVPNNLYLLRLIAEF